MKTATQNLSYGATVSGDQAEFRVWAPRLREITLRLTRAGEQPQDMPMQRDADDFVAAAPAAAGDRYSYVLEDGLVVPDPVSRFLPEGVHGATEIVDPAAFRWSDHAWRGIDLAQYVVYELHIGTFTPEGTFDAAIGKLEYLKQLGITVVEIMPVAACPGKHDWGYDGVSPYAVQANYGGPEGLKRLVDAAHNLGLAVMLDVVYNHLGPEGNYLPKFGPYFTAHHTTPWGEAVNYDSDGCEQVRRYVIENALYWIREYHIDGLRLDAVQTIKDDSPKHILAEIQERVQELAPELNRTVCVIAETDENDSRYIKPPTEGGYGLNAVWSDDFHHAVHAFFTGERQGYYQDFGDPQQIARALREGYVFQGEPFRFWNAPRGTSAKDVPLPANVICLQNHDQVGNRAKGERLSVLVPRGVRKLAAALLLLAPHTPLLFMGEEYDETAPFQFFADFEDPALKKAVSEGRRSEFSEFDFSEVPDPEDPATFERSKLGWSAEPENREMLEWYRRLLQLRKNYVTDGERSADAQYADGVLSMQVPSTGPELLVQASLLPHRKLPDINGAWREVLRSNEDGYEVNVFVRYTGR
ncbi:MAG TPA: malto-oligosyltrehalose trehalohydrolase [Gemmataceae bacterium]|nr:malto-oligosyltrehalose trehalohydrolase [Gemmataceae bacterium]